MSELSAPQTIEELLDRMLEVSDGLPKRLKQCADYVAANPDRIAVSTVAEMAEGAGVKPSAFMRFCQVLGFSGFSQMQRLFRDSYAQNWPDYPTRLEKLRESGAGSASALLAEFIEAGRLSLESLAKTIDPDTLDASIRALSQANMVHIVGLRRAFSVAAYFAYAFEKMNVPTMIHDHVGRLDNRHAIRKGDAVIAITFAPYTPETVELAEAARAAGAEVIAITDAIASPLRPITPLMLTVTEADFGDFRSLSATLSLAVALVVAVGATAQ
ncbi:MurR/RpiR family transcriptional regulator (plasmid) [Nitratireductor rhodophyticola]|uniref:MurR/RpiR family transcriptional regulator n=1 Tax=Nitratireductor rhodophyticola TaxID=2854036 RepID=A0ABS7RC45_9HYPH|nr:MurR/RpiR family transcriptional regulator [Nitratireductor rhodophyticola]MBY8918494.1 MurR/RpiR family transcriptional regulator [Nitratireductor rhodophyticola]MBY8922837.1 MurR/RpiR family transcriptional regulator [Nitratireductor rhodophyticola]MEC9244314.1 MurR/RpiR family transcriptional regulator [Pseudomonadota bacterium]WPZ16666.1 MurR/RpiR family transcriptional regulator [Nitratireductor rhodophyticola]